MGTIKRHAIQENSVAVFFKRLLLWQASVATSPHIFVIATCIWSDLIIYLFVICNKQLFSFSYGTGVFSCPYTFLLSSSYLPMICVKTQYRLCVICSWEKVLITNYKEVNDQIWSNTCCDDENERASGNTSLPEQHFQKEQEN